MNDNIKFTVKEYRNALYDKLKEKKYINRELKVDL